MPPIVMFDYHTRVKAILKNYYIKSSNLNKRQLKSQYKSNIIKFKNGISEKIYFIKKTHEHKITTK